MSDETRSLTVKILLTIPAICIGIFSAIIFIFKPLIDLWNPPKPPQEPLFDVHPVEEIKHDFH